MIDHSLIEKCVANAATKAGVKIAKDDPILLNALVIKALFEEQIKDTEKMSENLVSPYLAKMDESARIYVATLGRVNQSYINNTTKFLKSFEEVIVTLQEKEVRQWDDITEEISNKVSSKMVMPNIIQVLLAIAIVTAIVWDKIM